MRKIYLLIILIFCSKYSFGQVLGSISVGGDFDKYYPVTFFDGGWNNNVPTEVILGRSNTHIDSSWRGSLIASFRYHVTAYGHGSNFIEGDIKSTNNFIASWCDGSNSNASQCIVIWLRGGGTTYNYQSNYVVNPTVYDGVQNALPYNEVNGPTHSFKTTIEEYATSFGTYQNRNTYFMANVGIGTTNPQVKLDVLGGGHFKVPDDRSGIGGLTIETNNGTNLKMGGNFNYSWIQSHMSLPLYINELGNNTIFNLDGGNVGIGTTSPASKFQVSNSNSNFFVFDQFTKGLNITGNGWKSVFSDQTNSSAIGTNGGNLIFYNNTDSTERMRITYDGNVGIGTITPDSKLAVNGTIHSKEVKVDMNGWSDFVFKKEYNLPTLEEVEEHILEKGHLKDIPNEEEVLKNGINLGEMNTKLLQKIEELTLYMIEMKKENEAIKTENRLMRNNQIELEKRMSKIENK